MLEGPRFSGKKRRLFELLLKQRGLDGAAGGASPELARADGAGPAPLSYPQQRLWFLEQLAPGTAAHNLSAAIRLSGPLDAGALERGLAAIVRRHAALRTRFTATDGRPIQVVADEVAVPLVRDDLRHVPPEQRDAAAERAAREEARRPFDLARGPLLRARLVHLAEGEHVLVLVLHHVICDAWSMSIFSRELAALYRAELEGPPADLPALPVQYPDFARWQRRRLAGERLASQLRHWRERLRDAPPLTSLPTGRPRPAVQRFEGATHPLALSRELTARLRRLAQAEDATLFMALLAGFAALLHRHGGQEDLVIGTDVAGRDRAELEPLIGFFVNQLALRVDLSGEPTLRELVRRARRVALDAYAHQELPFDLLVGQLQPVRDPGRAPLFQTKLVLQNVPPAAVQLPGLRAAPLRFDRGVAQLDLIVNLAEAEGGLAGAIEYNVDLFDARTIAGLAADLAAVLEALAARPDTPLGQLGADPAAAAPGPRAGRRKAIPIGAGGLHQICVEEPRDGGRLPAIVRPAVVGGVELTSWAAAHRPFLDRLLLERGGVLFRGFDLRDEADLERFIVAVSGPPLPYHERSSPRTQVLRNIYTSTEHRHDQRIFLHNESSYQRTWPLKIFFFCQRPAARGGETTLADCRRVLARIPRPILERFEHAGWMYVRNFGDGLGLPWQTVFGTGDRGAVEAYCRDRGIAVEWKAGGRLRTRAIAPATVRHPTTGERIWFNHATFFQVATLAPEVGAILQQALGDDDLPTQAYYGDGSPIEPAVYQALRAAYEAEQVAVPWQRGDVLMLDNVLTAHGREPYTGERRVLVGMSEPMTRGEP